MSLPDVEMVLLAALRAEFPSVEFGTQIPGDLADRLPFATVKRAPAGQFHPRLATRPMIDVATWADDRKVASDLAWDACEFIVARRCGGLVSFAEAINEPFEIRDTSGLNGTSVAPAQGIYRFQATYRLVVRAS